MSTVPPPGTALLESMAPVRRGAWRRNVAAKGRSRLFAPPILASVAAHIALGAALWVLLPDGFGRAARAPSLLEVGSLLEESSDSLEPPVADVEVSDEPPIEPPDVAEPAPPEDSYPVLESTEPAYEETEFPAAAREPEGDVSRDLVGPGVLALRRTRPVPTAKVLSAASPPVRVAASTPAVAAPSPPAARAALRPAFRSEPEYPEALRQAGVEGATVVRVVVEPDGSVSQATVARSSGFPEFDEAALRALRAWRFHPLGRRSRAEIPVRFRLQ